MQGATILGGDSPQARAILHLFTIVLIIVAVIFAIVLTLVLINVIRFRRKKRRGEPIQDFGNPKLETLWTAIPAVILVVVFVITVRAMQTVQPPAADRAPNMIVTAHQWWWKAEYPGTGVVVANELHMPDNQLWLLRILSADVNHDFWVPNLGRKVDAIPGHPTHLWIKPNADGDYLGMCAEYCGAEHAWMRFSVVVEPPAQFDAWLQAQARDAAVSTDSQAVRGRELFMNKTCQNCHTVRGTQATGDVGPDLTHFRSRSRMAGGVLSTDPEDLAEWLRNPQGIKPGCYMPNFDLTDDEVRYLVAYLESLK